MKVALVGVGYWGSKLLRNLVGLVGQDRVVAVDADPSRLAWAARHFPAVCRQSGLAETLTDPEVAAVVVATPTGRHADQARVALAAGRHVLVEKPLTTSTEQAVALAELADRCGKVLMVGHTFLFSPRVRWIRSRLATVGVGRVRYVMSSRLNLGRHQSDANVIWDLASHDVSILLHLLGEPPDTVSANARGIARAGFPDVAFVDLTFRTGMIASVAVSWLAPRKIRNMTIVCDDSMIVYDDMEPDEPVKVYDKGIEQDSSTDFGTHQLTYRYGDTVAPHIAVQEPIADQIAHFVTCVEGGKRPLPHGWFGAQVVAVLEAAEESWLRGGVPVSVRKVQQRATCN